MKLIIENLKRTASKGLVIEVRYRVVGKQKGLLADVRGTVTLTGDPKAPDFTPFEKLTEEQVLSWVKSEVDVPAKEAEVRAILEAKAEKVAAKTTLSGLPWKNNLKSQKHELRKIIPI